MGRKYARDNIEGSGYLMPGPNDPPFPGGAEQVLRKPVDQRTVERAKENFDKDKAKGVDKGELGKPYEDTFGKPKK